MVSKFLQPALPALLCLMQWWLPGQDTVQAHGVPGHAPMQLLPAQSPDGTAAHVQLAVPSDHMTAGTRDQRCIAGRPAPYTARVPFLLLRALPPQATADVWCACHELLLSR